MMRSCLFCPGDARRKLGKLSASAADWVIIDLEDAVTPAGRSAARSATAAFLATRSSRLLAAVRINAPVKEMVLDLDAIVGPGLDAVMVPKVEEPSALKYASARVGELERRRGLALGSTIFIALIETARGAVACNEIARATIRRPLRLAFGPGDLALDLGVEPTADNPTLLGVRAALVLASCAAGLRAPIDGPFLHIHDLEGLEADSARSSEMGFAGRMALHPRQLEIITRSYSQISDAKAEWMERAVAHFDEERKRGTVAIQFEGEFLDPPIVERMRRTLTAHSENSVAVKSDTP